VRGSTRLCRRDALRAHGAAAVRPLLLRLGTCMHRVTGARHERAERTDEP
jgi:hypothetical protein